MKFHIAFLDKGNCTIEDHNIEAKSLFYALGRAQGIPPPKETRQVIITQLENGNE